MSRHASHEQVLDIIRGRHERGSSPGDIGNIIGKSAEYVREKLRGMGYEVRDGGGPTFKIHPMWSLDPSIPEQADALRMAIWEREQAGIKALRKANGGRLVP